MKTTRFFLLLITLGPHLAGADANLRPGTVAHFASVSEGTEILTRRDDFIQRLSPFDRSARMKTNQPISEGKFLQFVKASVLVWNDEEKRKIETAIAHIRPSIETLPLSLPKIIYVIKTSGAEEGKAFYTRDTAIVIPQSELNARSTAVLEKTIAHELFHILSRGNAELRETLYASIGFSKCPEIELPAGIKERKITNPDAPRNDHSIRLRMGGREVVGVPILFSKSEKYDVSRGGEFFDYLQFKFLLLPTNELVTPEDISGFFEQVGRNTTYVIHPEEILADNFALLVLNEQNVASPEILQRMRKILTQR